MVCKIRRNGNRRWYDSSNRLHRNDGPAFIYSDGSTKWYQNGRHHRNNGPAIERVDEYKAWYQHDKLHRWNGPAIEWADGTKEYWLNGNRRRLLEWRIAMIKKIESIANIVSIWNGKHHGV